MIMVPKRSFVENFPLRFAHFTKSNDKWALLKLNSTSEVRLSSEVESASRQISTNSQIFDFLV